MPVYLVVNKKTKVAENAIKWDGNCDYDPGDEYQLELVSGDPGCPWIGWTLNEDGSFSSPANG